MSSNFVPDFVNAGIINLYILMCACNYDPRFWTSTFTIQCFTRPKYPLVLVVIVNWAYMCVLRNRASHRYVECLCAFNRNVPPCQVGVELIKFIMYVSKCLPFRVWDFIFRQSSGKNGRHAQRVDACNINPEALSIPCWGSASYCQSVVWHAELHGHTPLT